VGSVYNAAAWLIDRHVAAGDGDRLAILAGFERLTYREFVRRVAPR
jgi:acyl-coenzyme A synthetase/AMP-(fatty) acid ligase